MTDGRPVLLMGQLPGYKYKTQGCNLHATSHHVLSSVCQVSVSRLLSHTGMSTVFLGSMLHGHLWERRRLKGASILGKCHIFTVDKLELIDLSSMIP